MSLLTSLVHVADYRRPGDNFRHPLLSILVISVPAVLSGTDDVAGIAVFGQQKQAVPARHLDLSNGVPTAETFRRAFEHLDAAAFNAAFLNWVRALLPAPVAAQICVDRQTLRGNGPQALHVVSARARAGPGGHHGQGGQPAIAEQIVDRGGQYLLALKRNQAGLWAEAERALEGGTAQHQATG